MATTNINIKLRPIKFAFLVDPSNDKSVLEAIRLATFLWGGKFCPIIPIVSRIPKVWKKNDPFFKFNISKVIEGYLDAYDPDFLVSVGGALPPASIDIKQREILIATEILKKAASEGVPTHGAGFFDIFNFFLDKEFKFVRRHPLTISLPKLNKKYETFLASVAGSLPEDTDAVLRKNYVSYVGIEEPELALGDYLKIFKPEICFPRQISSLYLKHTRPSFFRDGHCIFLMDAGSVWDVIDYWNLRACGWEVLPVPIQTMDDSDVLKEVEQFLKEKFGQSRHNPQIYYSASILKARSLNGNELDEFVKKIHITDPSGQPMFTVSSHYPRIWDAWAREHDGVERCHVWSDEEEHDIGEQRDRYSIRKLAPKFLNEHYSRHPCFANEIQIRSYGHSDSIAEVIPEGDNRLAKMIEGFGLDQWRFSKEGIVHLSDSIRGKINFSLPRSEVLFVEWLKINGIDAALSPAGKITKQILKQLGGIWGTSMLSHRGIIEMLAGISEGRSILKGEFERRLNDIVSQSTKRYGFQNKDKIKERLINNKILVLGARVQCSACSQHTWYSIKELDYELRCRNCGDTFALPSDLPKNIEWAYRANGLFDLKNGAYGSYSVLLVLRFFAQLLDGSTTPMPSFEYIDSHAKSHEVDLALFFRRSKFDKTEPDLIFVECKGLKEEFAQKDIDKMRNLASKFPGSILVFATLRESFSSAEKRLLKPIVNSGRKYWKSEKAYNPVLLLTGIELFSDVNPSQAWEDAGGPYEAFGKGARYVRELQEFCDLTQQIHLGMKPWHDWLRDKQEQKRQYKNRPT